MKTFISTLLVVIFFSCTKKQSTNYNIITVEGNLIDELSNNKFMPYQSATVSLYEDQTTQVPTPIATTTVDVNGYFKFFAEYKVGNKAILVLHSIISPNNSIAYTNNILAAHNVKSDFIIRCESFLYRTFVNQSNTAYDSIILKTTNSKGSVISKYPLNGYRTHLVYFIRGQESNYLSSKFYFNNSFTQRLDTINVNCRVDIKDSIFY